MTRTDPLMEHLLDDFMRATSYEERQAVARAIRHAHASACEARDTLAVRTVKLLEVAHAASELLGAGGNLHGEADIDRLADQAYRWTMSNGGET